ncbi:uncharacterized protein SPSK_00032 [Sporothrix schenckii 1099-18]|uniref:Uncharacterized protein n=1 Tax=Sporothrix schenckii 1099-18 TaxID=1397361 RepID=A0A0F2LVC6_SPOSC|nr:uncharacterized protein SPSK_00032 [Sporothrix schenckii 1099-18]KJR79851.1 hypothetical protein SPSK_00032 [Sporothrix schenckii 1099-18]
MSVPSKPDRSLLDRLNALKPSSVSLAAPQQSPGDPATTATTIAPTGDILFTLPSKASVTREDRLAARLKTLREVRDGNGSDVDNANEVSGKSEKQVSSSSEKQSLKSGGAAADGNSPRAADAEEGEAVDDPLFYVDYEAVDDLLLDLAAEGLGEDELGESDDEADRLAREDGTDGGDDDVMPLPSVPKDLRDASSGEEDDDADNSQMVEDLLKSLAGTAFKDDMPKSSKNGAPKTASKDADSDDSDGEDMEREVRRVLEQNQDEADLARQGGEGGNEQADEDEDEDIVTGPRKRDSYQEDNILPRDKLKGNFLGLPTVPTKLVDPPPSPPSLPSAPTQNLPNRGDDDDISARLAALRGLQGKATGLGQTDAFGMPSAPTFHPGEEEGGVLKRGHYGHGRRNYTDADQKAWCVVCLEDATVRCLGCADNQEGPEEDQNNAYCAGCWRDMHVGPAAGFDERGHKRVPLVR